MSLPFTATQCFFFVILIFIALGFIRGWKRELVSLVFILLAVFLVRSDTSIIVSDFLNRLPKTFGYLATGSASQTGSAAISTGTMTPFWSLVIFLGLIALGYYVGNKAFPAKPTTPQERFIGIVPAVISGAFVIYYLSNYLKTPSGQSYVAVAVESPDPSGYIPVVFIIAIVAVVIGLIASRAKKAQTPAKK